MNKLMNIMLVMIVGLMLSACVVDVPENRGNDNTNVGAGLGGGNMGGGSSGGSGGSGGSDFPGGGVTGGVFPGPDGVGGGWSHRRN